jgi:hypothetical protein
MSPGNTTSIGALAIGGGGGGEEPAVVRTSSTKLGAVSPANFPRHRISVGSEMPHSRASRTSDHPRVAA